MDRAPTFGLPFFYRVVLPGAVVTAFLSPLVFRLIDAIPRIAPYEGQVLLSLAVGLGFLLSILSDFIYESYEGRWWPSRLARWRTKQWQDHVSALLTKAQDQKDPAFAERWSELRQFPVATGDDGIVRPTATAPTKMGNVLASYEQYPQLRYGMESVFYWERLWLAIDKDVRHEIDSSWAPTDALLYASAGLFGASAVYLVVALVSLSFALVGPTYLDMPTLASELGAVVLGLALSGLLYSWSIPGHVANGEAFKSVFDLYRSRLAPMRTATAEERWSWETTFEMLQYPDYCDGSDNTSAQSVSSEPTDTETE